MKITILTSSEKHPVYRWLQNWRNRAGDHEIDLVLNPADAQGGDFLFLISCSDIVSRDIRHRYKHSLVIHASDLPEGRGWSPHIWQILEGKNDIVVSLLEAEDKVDTGRIWLQRTLHLQGHELYDEINHALFEITLGLMTEAINRYGSIKPMPQKDDSATCYPKRTPEDSRIDINLPLAAQFDLLRVADPARFPAFFEYRGHRYRIRIEKENMENND